MLTTVLASSSRLACVVGALWLCLGSWAWAGDVAVFVVDRDSKPVIDAVVVLKPRAGGAPAKPLATSATITQQRMLFLPPMTVVPVGGKINFVNNDPWEHHVRGSGGGVSTYVKNNTATFEFRLDGKPEGKPGPASEVSLMTAGPLLLGCHIHGSMRGHAFVTDSPWTQITPLEGAALFTEVPAGPATVRVWHADQILELPLQNISVAATGLTRIEVKLTVTPRRRRV